MTTDRPAPSTVDPARTNGPWTSRAGARPAGQRPVDVAGAADADLVALTTGRDYWSTHAAPAAGLRSLRVADGPHGLRLQDDENPDHLGLGRSVPATCFPPAVTLASSWDPGLVREIGAALGCEARASGVDVVLGPGMNLKRSPLCGRNFEYYSEDPLLTGVLAAAMVEGIQSSGVGACVKHFAVNNQETDRQRVDARVDERTLREMYLRAFEIVVRESGPWAVMSSYNRVNGTYASQNRWLLTTVLRDEWGFDGVVLSDWGAVHDPVAALRAGLDLRMPGRPGDTRVAEALDSGDLDREVLERTARRLALLADRTAQDSAEVASPTTADVEANHDLSRRSAAACAVLLQNDAALLPLTLMATTRLAVIGELARTPRYQGAGSSAVNPTRVVTGLEALTDRARRVRAQVEFAAGYTLTGSQDQDALRAEAATVAGRCDVVVAFLGLPDSSEAEGRDRTTIDLPAQQVRLLHALSMVGAPVIVALSNGGVVTTAPWRHLAGAVVEFWLTGQAHGDVVADVLLGDVNPGGKLAETVPARLADTPSYLDFPGEHGTARYGEGVHIGYRYYDARALPVDHPFGHGLSYTTFEYSDLEVTGGALEEAVAIRACFTLTNSGDRSGTEVAQLYVGEAGTFVTAPPRELRAWQRTTLEPGESRRIELTIGRDRLAHWHPVTQQWVYEGGPLTVHVGSSSRDLRLSGHVTVAGRRTRVPLTGHSTFKEWLDDPAVGHRVRALIDARGGVKGRLGDLLASDTGKDAVLDVPMSVLLEFPGVPLTAEDVAALACGS